METTRRDSRSTAIAAGMALALAGCAALFLAVGDAMGFVSQSTEAVFILHWIVGWVLLAWAAIIGGAVLVHLIRAVTFRRRPALVETMLLVVAAVVIAGVICAHPPVGSGTGEGVLDGAVSL